MRTRGVYGTAEVASGPCARRRFRTSTSTAGGDEPRRLLGRYTPPMPAVLDEIRTLLAAAAVPFQEIAHPAVASAEEAAAVRGTPLAMGAKSIVFKADGRFLLLAFSAARELSAKALRRHLGVSRTRFANRDELASLTGLPPGAVPPFGPPVLALPLYADPSLVAEARIVFTAGVRDRSILLASADWRAVAQPTVVTITR